MHDGVTERGIRIACVHPSLAVVATSCSHHLVATAVFLKTPNPKPSSQ